LALLKCRDCGHDVSDLASACPNCGRPVANDASRSGILPSNVASVERSETAQPRKHFPWPMALGALLVAVLGAAAALLLAPTPQRTPATPTAAPVAAANARQASVSAPLPQINGITCDALESTVVHIHAHLAIFVNAEEQQIPFGVGIGQPWDVADSEEGPFVDNGSCFYWLHTHTQDGVVHIESPVRRRFMLGDFFAIWQLPLSATQVGPAQGQVIMYVNGQRDNTNPPQVILLPHARIQLDVGGDVPPYAFEFPPGD
jgi:hypothetical protein